MNACSPPPIVLATSPSVARAAATSLTTMAKVSSVDACDPLVKSFVGLHCCVPGTETWKDIGAERGRRKRRQASCVVVEWNIERDERELTGRESRKQVYIYVVSRIHRSRWDRCVHQRGRSRRQRIESRG
jgi:hypothetical protein